MNGLVAVVEVTVVTLLYTILIPMLFILISTWFCYAPVTLGGQCPLDYSITQSEIYRRGNVENGWKSLIMVDHAWKCQ